MHFADAVDDGIRRKGDVFRWTVNAKLSSHISVRIALKSSSIEAVESTVSTAVVSGGPVATGEGEIASDEERRHSTRKGGEGEEGKQSQKSPAFYKQPRWREDRDSETKGRKPEGARERGWRTSGRAKSSERERISRSKGTAPRMAAPHRRKKTQRVTRHAAPSEGK